MNCEAHVELNATATVFFDRPASNARGLSSRGTCGVVEVGEGLPNAYGQSHSVASGTSISGKLYCLRIRYLTCPYDF